MYVPQRARRPGAEGLGQRAWGRGPGAEGLGQRAWARGPGPEGLGQRAWARGPGPEGLGQMDILQDISLLGLLPKISVTNEES